MVDKIINGIVNHYKLVIFIMVILTVVNIALALRVEINYDLSSYLPKEAASTEAINKMQDEFDETLPNVEVAIPNVSLKEALDFKEELLTLEDVSSVLWLDDTTDLSIPIDIQNQEAVESYYKDSTALYQVTIKDMDNALRAVKDLRELAGEDGAIRGQAVEMAETQRSVQTEILRIIAFAVPIAFVILLFATNAWFEPVLFLIVIFFGVLWNMGTNIIFDSISFITQSVAAVLQLAVTMDYAIFFLHRINDYREAGDPIDVAVKKSMKKSFQPIASSAATTFFGFLALVVMRFTLGMDLGLVLAKGIIFSMISVFIFLPALIMLSHKFIDKTTHRPLLPSFKGLANTVSKLAIPVMIIVIILAVPCFLGQRSNRFLYGMGAYPRDSRADRDQKFIDDEFGDNMPMAILVPRDMPAKEEKLIKEMNELPEIKSIASFLSMGGSAIPVELIPEDLTKPLLTDDYSRIVVISNSPSESPETFALAEHLRELVDDIYQEASEDTYLVGENFALLDMRDTIQEDNVVANSLAILAVALVIAIAFKSFTIPLILVLTIEISIWINLSVPYFTGTSLNYIGYLVISTVQLGATVDYGILLTQHYVENRQSMERLAASEQAISDTAGSLMSPGLILAAVGFVLYAISSISVVSEIGLVLGRGALISLIMVLFLLPNLLRLLDPLIEKTTWKVKFLPSKLRN